MSKLAKEFNNSLRRQNHMYAAWLPVTNTLKVGDFGIINGGVFRALGNIKDTFGIDFNVEEGPKTEVDIASEGTTVVKVVGGAEVPAFPPNGDLEAKINVSFSKENSFLVKAKLTCLQMSNIQEVAWKLVKEKRWKRSYKVVESTYIGKDSVIILSSESNTTVGLTGSVDALKMLEAGQASVDVGVERENKASFQSIGEEGVIGLRLFKLGWSGSVKTLKENEVEVEKLDSDLEDDF